MVGWWELTTYLDTWFGQYRKILGSATAIDDSERTVLKSYVGNCIWGHRRGFNFFGLNHDKKA